MAAAGPTGDAAVEALVCQLLDLRKDCTQSLPDDVVRRIATVRGLCQAAEATDGNGQFAWRRGTQSRGGSSSSHSHRWRNSANSQKTQSPGNERPAGRQVSKFTNSEAPVENKILNQVILNKLNKFSSANQVEVKEFLEQVLDSNDSEFLHDFMNLVFKKAATEPTFCALYAKMISELSVKQTCLLSELNNLQTKYMDIFEEVTEEQCSSQEQFVQRNREKQHRLGQSQFLGELTSQSILELEQLKKLYLTILSQIQVQSSIGESKILVIEEYVDCLLRMTRAFQKGRNAKLVEIRKQLLISCEPVLEDILAKGTSNLPGLSKKGAFALMDCLDILRDNAFPA